MKTLHENLEDYLAYARSINQSPIHLRIVRYNVLRLLRWLDATHGVTHACRITDATCVMTSQGCRDSWEVASAVIISIDCAKSQAVWAWPKSSADKQQEGAVSVEATCDFYIIINVRGIL